MIQIAQAVDDFDHIHVLQNDRADTRPHTHQQRPHNDDDGKWFVTCAQGCVCETTPKLTRYTHTPRFPRERRYASASQCRGMRCASLSLLSSCDEVFHPAACSVRFSIRFPCRRIAGMSSSSHEFAVAFRVCVRSSPCLRYSV